MDLRLCNSTLSLVHSVLFFWSSGTIFQIWDQLGLSHTYFTHVNANKSALWRLPQWLGRSAHLSCPSQPSVAGASWCVEASAQSWAYARPQATWAIIRSPVCSLCFEMKKKSRLHYLCQPFLTVVPSSSGSDPRKVARPRYGWGGG